MYAIVQKGTKQFRVEEGKTIEVDLLETSVGDEVLFDEVLLVGDGEKTTVGKPFVNNAKVSGILVDNAKDKKIVVFRYKKRKTIRKKTGHRQDLSLVKINKIEVGS